MFVETSFNLGDVDDPHLYAQMHIQKLREDGVITAANVSYVLQPDQHSMGHKVLVYDEDKRADLENLRVAMQEYKKSNEERSEALWNSFDVDQQIDLFCAVVRRLCKAELDDQGTYRHALYNVFGFHKGSYSQALDAGFMALHNSIFADKDIDTLIKNFCSDHELVFTPEQIQSWTVKHRYY